MIDPRIARYREAAMAVRNGKFDVEIPVGTEDEVGLLGKALCELRDAREREFEETRKLATITERINAGLTLDEVLRYVYDSFQTIIPYDRIGFALLEEKGEIVRARWARSRAPTIEIQSGYWAPMQGSSLEQIIQTGQPRILNDLELYLREHPDSDSTRRIVREGMRSSLTCPLIALGKPVGFVFFSSMQPHAYEDVHVELFLQIAGQLSLIVEKGRLYQRLVDLNETKNKFLGIAAHDLRSPLSVVKGYLALLLRGLIGEISEQQREVLQTMDQTCETMLVLMNDLLDVSAIESGRLVLESQEVDLAEYLRTSHAGNALLARSKNIELRLELEAALPKVRMDRGRISQVISNLITNAIKFSHPDTVITVKARAAGDHVEISVVDQGQGIPKEEIPKLFREFVRTSVRPTADEKSTGLGLAIVKRIVEAHGGRIWVESGVGAGSTFTFSLPLEGPPDTDGLDPTR